MAFKDFILICIISFLDNVAHILLVQSVGDRRTLEQPQTELTVVEDRNILLVCVSMEVHMYCIYAGCFCIVVCMYGYICMCSCAIGLSVL